MKYLSVRPNVWQVSKVFKKSDKAKENKCWVSTNIAKKIRVGRSVINFIIFFKFYMLFHDWEHWLKCWLSSFIRSYQNCSMTSIFAVPTRWFYSFILSFQLCINKFANKICRARPQNRVGRVSGNSTFFFLA